LNPRRDLDEIVNTKLVRLFGWFGIVTPVLGFTMIFLAISTAPWFSWQGNALSDLGVEGLTAAIFNGGLVMTGSVMAVFSLSVYEFGKEDRLGKVGFVLLLLACILLLGIGVFPETAGDIQDAGATESGAPWASLRGRWPSRSGPFPGMGSRFPRRSRPRRRVSGQRPRGLGWPGTLKNTKSMTSQCR
jgi:hypothetical protein